VIITRHNAQTGRGQEQAVARLLSEAYEAAADALRFQEESTLAWQVRRVFERSQEADASVTINAGEYNETRGISYSQTGRRARGRLLSLENDSPLTEDERIHYRLAKAASGEKIKPGTTFLDGLELPEKLARSLAVPKIGELSLVEAVGRREPLIAALTEKLVEKRGEGSTSELQDRYGDEFFRMTLFIGALERALALACGLSFEITLDDRVLVAGQSVTARLVLRNGGALRFPAVIHLPESLAPSDETALTRRIDSLDLVPGGVITREAVYETPKAIAITLPHTSQLYKESYYPVGSSLPGSLTPEPFGVRLFASAEIGIGITSIMLPALIRFDVVSPVEIATTPFLVVKDWDKPREAEIVIRALNRTRGELEGALWVVPLALAQDDYEPVHIKFGREDEEAIVRLRLALPIAKPPVSPDILIEFRREKPAPQDALGSFTIKVRLMGFEVAEGLNVGYIPGPASWIPIALSHLGVSHSELSADQIRSGGQGDAEPAGRPRSACGDLSRFQTILVGDRALSSMSEFPSISHCLLEYVRRGGRLVVFYQRAVDWNTESERREIAPFPIRLSGERITQEKAGVRLIEKAHPLLTKPNAITEQDFSGWVRHRALYLPDEWDGHYTTILESYDPGEKPHQGGLLVTKSGEGTYIYMGYDLGRQIQGMNPGAFRLLANLISPQ
ncbi:MAG TPA: hypothetical protein VLD57_00020, partial [Blastocatellia bacterium]|nr:hypothetical protein [Blastocatellia bacterium]